MFVLITIRKGANESVHLGTEQELKKIAGGGSLTWMDFGYKQSAHVNDYVICDLFKVEDR